VTRDLELALALQYPEHNDQFQECLPPTPEGVTSPSIPLSAFQHEASTLVVGDVQVQPSLGVTQTDVLAPGQTIRGLHLSHDQVRDHNIRTRCFPSHIPSSAVAAARYIRSVICFQGNQAIADAIKRKEPVDTVRKVIYKWMLYKVPGPLRDDVIKTFRSLFSTDQSIVDLEDAFTRRYCVPCCETCGVVACYPCAQNAQSSHCEQCSDPPTNLYRGTISQALDYYASSFLVTRAGQAISSLVDLPVYAAKLIYTMPALICNHCCHLLKKCVCKVTQAAVAGAVQGVQAAVTGVTGATSVASTAATTTASIAGAAGHAVLSGALSGVTTVAGLLFSSIKQLLDLPDIIAAQIQSQFPSIDLKALVNCITYGIISFSVWNSNMPFTTRLFVIHSLVKDSSIGSNIASMFDSMQTGNIQQQSDDMSMLMTMVGYLSAAIVTPASCAAVLLKSNSFRNVLYNVNAMFTLKKSLTNTWSGILQLLPDCIRAWFDDPSYDFKTEVLTKIRDLENLLKKQSEATFVKDENVRLFVEKYTALADLRFDSRIKLLDNPTKVTFRTFLKDTSPVAATLAARINKGGTRMVPYVGWFYGPPGVGKSYLLDYIYKTMRSVFPECIDLDKPDGYDPASMIYSRSATDYWDGYLNQKIVAVDDYGATKDDPVAKEMPKMVSSAEWHPNFASLTDSSIGKKGTLFTSEMILITSNSSLVTPADAQCPDAYKRRRDIFCYVTTDYMGPDGKFSPELFRRANPNGDLKKCEHLSISLMNPLTNRHATGDKISAEQLVHLLRDRFVIHKNTQLTRLGKEIPPVIDNYVFSPMVKYRLPGDLPELQCAAVQQGRDRVVVEKRQDYDLSDRKQFDHTDDGSGSDFDDQPLPSSPTRFDYLNETGIEVRTVFQDVQDYVVAPLKRMREFILKDPLRRAIEAVVAVVAFLGGSYIISKIFNAILPFQESFDYRDRSKAAKRAWSQRRTVFPQATQKCETPEGMELQGITEIAAFAKNMVRVEAGRSGTGLGICDRIVVCPAHYFYTSTGNLLSTGFMIKIIYDDNSSAEVLFSPSTVEFVESPLGRVDFAFLYLGKSTRQFRDVRHRFISREDVNAGDIFNGAIARRVESSIAVQAVGRCRFVVESPALDLEHPIFDYSTGIAYTADTKSGDCGSLIFSEDQNAPVCGMHVIAVDTTKQSMAVVITREDLFRLLPPKVSNMQSTAPVQQGHEPRLQFDGTNFEVVGRLAKKDVVHQPTVCDYAISPLFEMVDICTPNLSEPAILSISDARNVQAIPPLKKSVEKYFHEMPDIPQNLLDVAQHWTFYELFPDTDFQLAKWYSVDEAINGFHGGSKMDLTTSPGYPYMLNKRYKGKKGLFMQHGCRWQVSSPQLEHRLTERTSSAYNAMRTVDSWWVDLAKSELRPKEKIQQVKTRSITCAPVDFTILARQSCGAFIDAFHNSCLESFSAVGINPFSSDWNTLYHQLKVHPNWTDIDLKTCDGTVSNAVMLTICSLVEQFYDECGDLSGSHRNVIRTIFDEIATTYCINEDCAYIKCFGNPSGNPMTTIINTLAVHYYIIIAWIKLGGRDFVDFFTFKDNVVVIHYGDDIIMSVSDEVADWFHPQSIADVLVEYGITMTSGRKGEPLGFCDEGEVTFLKNSFGLHPGFPGRVVAVSAGDTLSNMLNWWPLKNGKYDLQAVQSKMVEVMRRIFFCGPQKYNFYYQKFLPIMKKLNMTLPPYYEFSVAYSVKDEPRGFVRHTHSLVQQSTLDSKARVAEYVLSKGCSFTLSKVNIKQQCVFFIMTLEHRVVCGWGYDAEQVLQNVYHDMYLFTRGQETVCLGGVARDLTQHNDIQIDLYREQLESWLEDNPEIKVNTGCEVIKSINDSPEDKHEIVYHKRSNAVFVDNFPFQQIITRHTDVASIYNDSCRILLAFLRTNQFLYRDQHREKKSMLTQRRPTQQAEFMDALEELPAIEDGLSAAMDGLDVARSNEGGDAHEINAAADEEAASSVAVMSQSTDTRHGTALTANQQPASVETHFVYTPPVRPMCEQSWDYKAMLERWNKIGTQSWSASAEIGTFLYQLEVPSGITAGLHAKSFAQFEYWRGPCELQLMINATQFHHGYLIAGFVAGINLDNFKAMYGNPCENLEKIYSLEYAWINANENNLTHIRVPFLHAKNYITVDVTTPATNTMDNTVGVFFVMVGSPLVAATGSSSTIHTAVMASFPKAELHVPAVTGSSQKTLIVERIPYADVRRMKKYYQYKFARSTVRPTTQGDSLKPTSTSSKPDHLKQKDPPKPKVVSQAPVKKKEVKHVEKPPVVKPKTVKPAVKKAPKHLVRRAIGPVNYCSGRDHLERFQINECADEPASSKHIGSTNVTSIDSLNARFNYLDTITWTDSQEPDTVLYKFPINPWLHMQRNLRTVESQANFHFTVSDYLANTYTYWRGGITIIIRVAALKSQSGRLILSYHPNYFGSGGFDAVARTSQYYNVMEVGQVSSVFSVTCSFVANRDFLFVGAPNHFNATNSLGYAELAVQNSLVASVNGPSSANIIIGFTFAKGFEWSFPKYNIHIFPGPVSDDEEAKKDHSLTTPTVRTIKPPVTQATSKPPKGTLTLGDKPILLGTCSNLPPASKTHFGNEIKDITELFRKYSSIGHSRFVSTTIDTGTSIMRKDHLSASAIMNHNLGYWLDCYGAYRGATRFKVIYTSQDHRNMVYWTPNIGLPDITDPWGPDQDNQGRFFYFMPGTGSLSYAEFEVPFASMYNFLYSPNATKNTRTSADALYYDTGKLTVYCPEASESHYVDILQAFSDNSTLGAWLGPDANNLDNVGIP
jgi:hypothetical protein